MQKNGHQIVKNEMFIFGLHSTSDDWPSNLSNESHLKCKKMAAKSLKNEMQFRHPPPDEMGTGQEWYGNGPRMGQVWDGNGPGMGWDDIGGFHADCVLPC